MEVWRLRHCVLRTSRWAKQHHRCALGLAGLCLLVLTCALALLLVSDARYLHGHLTPDPRYVHAYTPHAAAHDQALAAAAHGAAPAPSAVAGDAASASAPSSSSARTRTRIAVVTMTDFRPRGSDGHKIAQWSWLNKWRYAHTHGYDCYFHTRKHTSWWRPAVWGKLTVLLHHLHQTVRVPLAPGQPVPPDALPDPAQTQRDAADAAAAAADLHLDTDRPRPPPAGTTNSRAAVRTALVPRYEWVLWLDADTVVMERDTRVETLIDEFQRDYGLHNKPASSSSSSSSSSSGDDVPTTLPQLPQQAMLFATDDHGAADRKLNAGVLLLRNAPWTIRLLQRVFALQSGAWRYLLHWEQEQKALWHALREADAERLGLWVKPPCARFNALHSEYTRAVEERDAALKQQQQQLTATSSSAAAAAAAASSVPPQLPFLIHTAGCASETYRMSCATNYWQRAWTLYERRWGTTLRDEVAYVERAYTTTTTHGASRSSRSSDGTAAPVTLTLAQIFPELYGDGLALGP